MRKFLKITSKLLMLLLLLIAIGIYVILYTETGARWVIHGFSEFKIKEIEGNLATSLKLSNISYSDSQLSLGIDEASYNIENIQWFSRRILIQQIFVNQLDLQLKESSPQQDTPKKFTGLSLPVSIVLDSLQIEKVNLISELGNRDLGSLQASIQAEKQNIIVSNLEINQQNYTVNGAADLQLNPELDFSFSPQWTFINDENIISGVGLIDGNSQKISFKQELNLEQGTLVGQLQMDSTIDLSNKTVNIDTSMRSELLELQLAEQEPLAIRFFNLQLDGLLDAYQLTSSFNVDSMQLEPSQVSLKAHGDLNSMEFTQLDLNHSQASIKLPSQISWQQGIQASSQVNIENWNPASYFPQWQGLVNGSMKVESKLLENGDYEVLIDKADIIGELKQQVLQITTKAKITSKNIEIQPSLLILGENRLELQAQIKDEDIQARFKAQLMDLNLFDDELSGQIKSNLELQGKWNQPQINATADIKGLQFQQHKVGSLNLKANGDWVNDFTLDVDAKQLTIEKQIIDSLIVEVTGNQLKHQISAVVDDELISSEFQAAGSFNKSNTSWQGTIKQHEFMVKEINSQWQLTQEVDVAYGKEISLTTACWQNAHGDICLDLESNSNHKEFQMNLAVNRLNMQALKNLMPKNWLVDGEVNGTIKINSTPEDIHINSNIELQNGQLHYALNTDKTYSNKISKANLRATHNAKNSNVLSIIELEDGSHLLLDFDLFKEQANEQSLSIDGSINGFLSNTTYLTSLSPEIKAIDGDFKLNGSIKGPVNKPVIHLTAKQNGYLILSQTNSKFENISLAIDQQIGEAYQLQFSGHSKNGGFIEVLGQLDKGDSETWELRAKAKGENFELLKLAEIELNISPDFEILANAQGTNIKGKLKIPYAKLSLEQLPESAISTSSDVFVHKGQEKDKIKHKVQFDVVAEIENPVEINAIGLVTDLTGSIRIKQIENSIVDAYGSLKLINGKYNIYGQTLNISTGDLIFNGPIDNPGLDIVASRKSIDEEVLAGIELGGNINRLQSSLYSTPALSDLEILSYIMTGKGIDQDSHINSQQLAQTAVFLGLKKSSPIFSEIQSKLGIDVLNFKEAAETKDSLVEAGKNFNDKLYVGYNQGIFSRIGFWVLRYKINKALRLESTQGENQSVDLIYVRTKK